MRRIIGRAAGWRSLLGTLGRVLPERKKPPPRLGNIELPLAQGLLGSVQRINRRRLASRSGASTTIDQYWDSYLR
ncbi:MAG TPA: hypothetical protein VGL08_00500 [Paraburkholderia sp.]|jgi:hypothetical protein